MQLSLLTFFFSLLFVVVFCCFEIVAVAEIFVHPSRSPSPPAQTYKLNDLKQGVSETDLCFVISAVLMLGHSL
jgi:hypothetical protein